MEEERRLAYVGITRAVPAARSQNRRGSAAPGLNRPGRAGALKFRSEADGRRTFPSGRSPPQAFPLRRTSNPRLWKRPGPFPVTPAGERAGFETIIACNIDLTGERGLLPSHAVHHATRRNGMDGDDRGRVEPAGRLQNRKNHYEIGRASCRERV